MGNRHFKSTIFKLVQNNLLFGNTSFGKNTNAQALIQPSFGPSINTCSAFNTVPIHKNAHSFVKKTKNGDTGQLHFPHKYKRVSTYMKHQHNIQHTGMVGHQHVTLSFLHRLFTNHFREAAHSIQNGASPKSSSEPEKLGIGFFRNSENEQKRKKQKNGNGNQNIEPNPI